MISEDIDMISKDIDVLSKTLTRKYMGNIAEIDCIDIYFHLGSIIINTYDAVFYANAALMDDIRKEKIR